MEERYIATMLLHAVGDTIGFKNGDWEFFSNNQPYSDTLEKLYEFINLGGVNNINLDGWHVSDDTILHIAIASSLTSKYESDEELNQITVKKIISACDEIIEDDIKKKYRYIGDATKRHYDMLKKGNDWKKFPFDARGGGNGAAMRSHCIGLAFCGIDNREKLIQYAIDSSKMTHTNPIGWMGGVVIALMTAFAIEDIHINKWMPLLSEILASEKIKKNIDMNNADEVVAYETFIQNVKSYYEARFKEGKPIITKANTNFIQRLMFYNSLFDDNMSKYGKSGYSAVIVAYDCLVDAKDSWEKLIIYAMINNFDSDTIGSIAGGLFGAINGIRDIPKNNWNNNEKKESLIKLGKLLYRKYHKL